MNHNTQNKKGHECSGFRGFVDSEFKRLVRYNVGSITQWMMTESVYLTLWHLGLVRTTVKIISNSKIPKTCETAILDPQLRFHLHYKITFKELSVF